MSWIIAACGFCAPLATQFAIDDQEKIAQAMNGTWQLVSGEVAGNPLPKEVLESTKLKIEPGTYRVTVGDLVDRGRVKLDVSRTPMALDVTGDEGPNKGKTMLAVFELKGDTLTVCYDLSGAKRPEGFKSGSEPTLFLAVYKRVK